MGCPNLYLHDYCDSYLKNDSHIIVIDNSNGGGGDDKYVFHAFSVKGERSPFCCPFENGGYLMIYEVERRNYVPNIFL